MSELRIALVAEGPTDAIVIQAALRAQLGRPFVLTVLQPEQTLPHMGTGWCGVFRWCQAFARRGAASLEADPTLFGFDLFVIHLDADVADKSYGGCGNSVADMSRDLPDLPRSKPCPPPSDAVDEIRGLLLDWLEVERLGSKTILCVPSKAIDTWLATAILEGTHELLDEIECHDDVAGRLQRLPMGQRIRKTQRAYRAHENRVTACWPEVRTRCTQADAFSLEVAKALDGQGANSGRSDGGGA